MHPYVALLRGINVGGHNIITKDELKNCFEDCGFEKVSTYIQSGNIVFLSSSSDDHAIRNMLETELSKRFEYSARVVVISLNVYRNMMKSAPKDWGTDGSQKHNILFLIDHIDSSEWIAALPEAHKDIEAITPGSGVVYWSLSKEHQMKTSYMELPKKKTYKQVTIRNDRTAKKVLEMLEAL